GCNGLTTLNTPTGSITDGPGNYENNANCKFLVQIPGATYIDFSFSQFNTQANFDIVRIYQGTDSLGTLVGTFSGATIPSGVTVAGSSAFVQFISNGFTVNTGYVLNYVSGNCVLPATPTISPADTVNLIVTPSATLTASEGPVGSRYLWSTGDTTRSITVNAVGSYSVRIIVGTCTSLASNRVVALFNAPTCSGNLTLTSLTGTIIDGPGQYTNLRRCSWLINPPAATSLTINFLNIDMESCCDFVDIFDGPDSTFTRIGRYTGTAVPPSITVPGGVA
ncbi:MAG: CUB domain-containing protein, partial [Dolichospermum sp.]